ncbi:Holliday junction ATP-dependent DNA helicase RuvA [Alphaproteobacteria bacterium]|nr:Holliday junction ATP-dependent DNA helicase RuvA [Alphaproteobacteria bacterium]
MIGKLKGIVDFLGDDFVILDVGGVGYKATCSSRTLSGLGRGTPATLWIETLVRQDMIALYGFTSRAEQDWFLTLTGVQGVGARLALAILGALGTEELALALAAGDKAALTRVPGVGPKMAARLATELRDKTGRLAQAASGDVAVSAGLGGDGKLGDAVSALANLGYQRSDALRAAAAAMKAKPDAPLNELIVAALKELAR